MEGGGRREEGTFSEDKLNSLCSFKLTSVHSVG